MATSRLEKLYESSPVLVQNVMTSGAGYQRNRHRYGPIYRQHRKWLREFDDWSLDRKLQYQASELARFVRFAVQNSPFYRSLYREAGVDPSRILGPSDLVNLPLVDKELLRRDIQRAYTISQRKGIEGHTGGTTGKSLVILATSEDSQKRMAMLDHFKSRVGFENRRMTRATFSGKHIVPPGQKHGPYWRYNAATRQMLFSTFHLTEETLPQYVERLRDYRPQSIDGFPSSIAQVAQYLLRRGIDLGFRPIAVFPTSETVTAELRETLEGAFQAKVFDQYASSEGAPFITECRKQVAHIELSTGVFEQVPGADNEIAVTSFTTHGTPLIRYRIGDAMHFGPTFRCACGLETPTVAQIMGRGDDFLYRSDGGRVNSGNVSNLFKNLPNSVIKSQAQQRSKDCVTILLQVDPALYRPEHDALLREEFLRKFGAATRLVIQHVDEIPNEPSGKFRMIKNYVAKEQSTRPNDED